MEVIYIRYRNMLKMLKHRGYEIPEIPKYKNFFQEYKDLPIEEVKDKMGITCSNKKQKQIQVLWINGKMGIDEFKKIYESIITTDIKQLIFVCEEKNTIHTTNAISMVKKTSGIKIEIFMDVELGYCPVEHELVPTHILCSKKQEKEILKSFPDKSKYPLILSSDVIAKYLGAEKGQIIKIIRPSMTMPSIPDHNFTNISYRLVI